MRKMVKWRKMLEILNPKSEILNKFEIKNSNISKSFFLSFGYLNLFRIWCLGFRIFSCLILIGCGGSVCGDSGEAPNTVTVITASGSTQFTVEIADTEAERATGLMNRTDLSSRQ